MEVRTRHGLSRDAFSALAGFTGKSSARLNNIEKKDSWKPGDREAIARLLNGIEDGTVTVSAPTTRSTSTKTKSPRSTGAVLKPIVIDTVTLRDGTTITVDQLRVTPLDADGCLPTMPVIATESPSAEFVDLVQEDDLLVLVSPYDSTLAPLVTASAATTQSAGLPAHYARHHVFDVQPTPDVHAFSNSELQTWKTCRRKWWLAWYRQLQLQAQSFSDVRATGTRVHRALEAWYVPDGEPRVDPRTALERIVVEDWTSITELAARRGVDDEHLAALAVEFTSATNLERAMIEGYVQWLAETGADADLRVIGSEQPMIVDTTTHVHGEERPIQLIGLLDTRVRRTTDDVRMFIDHKPQPLSAPILTPTGWSKMGELKVGDVISGAYGEPIRVTHIFDRGVDDVYEVTLNDGTAVQATADHPWMARDTVHGQWKIVETAQLKSKRHRIMGFTPRTDDADVELPIDPYTLGMWIANGSRNGNSVCDGVPETLEPIGSPVIQEPMRAHQTKSLYSVKLPREIQHVLDELGLLDRYSKERFIPQQYIHAASYRQRLALLHGLMDGDGCLTTYSHSSIYVTTSARLGDDVAALARSLGAWAKIWAPGKLNHVGKRSGGYDTTTTTYTVSIRSEFVPFKHVHHAERWTAHREKVRGHRGTTSTDKIVKSVKLIGREPVRCIEVDSNEKLYVTSDYAVSHNTVGDLSGPVHTLPQNEQMLHYHLLEWLSSEDTEDRCDGALYNMIRRVKRSQRAKPPFYARVEVRHNQYELDAYKRRMLAAASDILVATERLDRGESHLDVVYPSPNGNCTWSCDFFVVCNMFDDGSRSEDMLTGLYRTGNPRARYEKKG